MKTYISPANPETHALRKPPLPIFECLVLPDIIQIRLANSSEFTHPFICGFFGFLKYLIECFHLYHLLSYEMMIP